MVKNCFKEELKHYIIQEVKFIVTEGNLIQILFLSSVITIICNYFILYFLTQGDENSCRGKIWGPNFAHGPKTKKRKFSVKTFFFQVMWMCSERDFLAQEKQKHLKWINQDKEPRYLIALFLEHLVFTLNPSAISLNC